MKERPSGAAGSRPQIMNNTQDPAGSQLAPTTGSVIFAEIAAEVERATAKFPTWPTDALHAVGVVAEEMGELQKEVMQLTYEPHKSTPEMVRKEAVQLAAMSLRFLMSLDRYAYEPRPQHSQNDTSAPARHENAEPTTRGAQTGGGSGAAPCSPLGFGTHRG